MFWMRNKENNFPKCTLIWRPVQIRAGFQFLPPYILVKEPIPAGDLMYKCLQIEAENIKFGTYYTGLEKQKISA